LGDDLQRKGFSSEMLTQGFLNFQERWLVALSREVSGNLVKVGKCSNGKIIKQRERQEIVQTPEGSCHTNMAWWESFHDSQWHPGIESLPLVPSPSLMHHFLFLHSIFSAGTGHDPQP
jgi:hypothetical protein